MPLPGQGQPISLPVLAERPRGRMARRRMWVMIAIHILIVIHLAHWLITGRTMAPTVFSESMKTLEQGQINPGFLAFALAAAATLLVGRFLCGWGCHMGGLQDLCGWLLKKARLRPRPFRARLLGYAPIVLALYMFLWPTLRRDALAPLLEKWWPQALPYIGNYQPFPGWTTTLTTAKLWDGLPGWALAIPFLLVCGGATVYFLGSRGFCRYGCPYGGVLSPLDQLAPGRVVLDAGACTSCGLCTAACSVGVRVMEEGRAYGSVVSRSCVRSLDCIEACPTGALSFGWTRPAALKRRPKIKPRLAYDLTLVAEISVLAMFALAFFAMRGLYGIIPMFMAIGMAICAAFVGWKGWRLLQVRDARLARVQLKRGGRLRLGGVAFMALAGVLVLGVAHAAVVQGAIWTAGIVETKVTVPREVVLHGRQDLISEHMRAQAGAALKLYRVAGPMEAGGIGVTSTPPADLRAAWLHLVRGEYEQAETLMRRAGEREPLTDALAADLARIVMLARGPEAAVQELEELVEGDPGLVESRDLLAALYAGQMRLDAAEDVYRRALAARPQDARARARLASIQFSKGDLGGAVEGMRQAVADAPKDPMIRQDLAVVLFWHGDVEGALASMEAAVGLDIRSAGMFLNRAAEMAAQAGRPEQARAYRERAAAFSR